MNTYGDPPRFWEDMKFLCADCGESQQFTAAEQREFYEVEKNPIYVKKVRCQRCEGRRIEKREIRRLFSEALESARRSNDPAVIRAGVLAIMKHGENASGGARKALNALLDRIPTEFDDDLLRRAHAKVRSHDR